MILKQKKVQYSNIGITRGDLYLILIILITGLILFLMIQISSKSGQCLYVYYAQKLVTTVQLNKNENLNIQGDLGISQIVIRDGQVWMEKSPCPQKICIHMGKITHHGQSIVCIPNRIVLLIKKNHDPKIDAITQ